MTYCEDRRTLKNSLLYCTIYLTPPSAKAITLFVMPYILSQRLNTT